MVAQNINCVKKNECNWIIILIIQLSQIDIEIQIYGYLDTYLFGNGEFRETLWDSPYTVTGENTITVPLIGTVTVMRNKNSLRILYNIFVKKIT